MFYPVPIKDSHPLLCSDLLSAAGSVVVEAKNSWRKYAPGRFVPNFSSHDKKQKAKHGNTTVPAPIGIEPITTTNHLNVYAEQEGGVRIILNDFERRSSDKRKEGDRCVKRPQPIGNTKARLGKARFDWSE